MAGQTVGLILYCSFCGKSQHEVRKLVAGPAVYMCDECIELCVDIIYDDDGNARITRTIVFDPENAQAGISILANFSKIIQQKYPGVPVEVKIEQKGNEVSMLIITPGGEEERVLETLEDYGKVVLGHLRPDQLLSDPLHVLELTNKLRLAQMELQMTREIMEQGRLMSSGRIDSLETQVASLHALIGKGLASIPSVEGVLDALRRYQTGDEELKKAVCMVLSAHAEGISKPSPLLMEALQIIEARDAGLYGDMRDILKDWLGGVAVSATSGLAAAMIAVIPK